MNSSVIDITSTKNALEQKLLLNQPKDPQVSQIVQKYIKKINENNHAKLSRNELFSKAKETLMQCDDLNSFALATSISVK